MPVVTVLTVVGRSRLELLAGLGPGGVFVLEGDLAGRCGEQVLVLGVARGTLVRWWQQGLVTPALVTAVGHARWDVEDLREQLKTLRLREQDD